MVNNDFMKMRKRMMKQINAKRKTEQRVDPPGTYRFSVEIDNLIVAEFTEVSGVQIETEIEEYREGGLNEYAHKFVKGTRHVPIILKRGISTEELWNWYCQVCKGKIVRRNGAIILFDKRKKEFKRWTFFDAYPVKWVGPEFNANSSEVAIQQIELVHNGFKMES